MQNPVLLVCGSRRWADFPRLAEVLDKLIRPVCRPVYSAVWHGGAGGADSLAARWAAALPCPLPVRVWPADWHRYGRAAGVRRSAEMLAAAPPGSLLVAFVPGRLADSAGTAHTVRLARRRGLTVVVVDSDGQRVLAEAQALPQLEAFTMKLTFKDWLAKVDAFVARLCVTVPILPGRYYAALYEEGLSPTQAARRIVIDWTN